MRSAEQLRVDRTMKKMNRCKHFNGIQHDACAAGVDYALVKDMTTSPYRFACFKDDGGALACPVAEFPTAAEAEAEIVESDKRLAAAFEARAAIVERRQGSGVVPCPACGKGLHFSVARSNGHVWGRCETEGCLAWME
jgi:hypothetical protein